MCLKIRCDGESWKILGFWEELNKALKHTDVLHNYFLISIIVEASKFKELFYITLHNDASQ